MKPTFCLFIACAFSLVACDKQERAEARQEARETMEEIKEASSEMSKDVKKATSEMTKDIAEAANSETNKLKVKGSWHVAKGKLKQKYAELTEDDLLYEEGKEDELYGRLQHRLGKNREEVEKELEGL